MKKILVVVESLRINTTSSGIVSSTFLRLLTEAGYDITILTTNDFNYAITWLDNKIKIKKFDRPEVEKSLIDRIPKLRAISVYLNGFSKEFIILKNHWKKEVIKELQNEEYDAIYALGSGSEFATHFALSEMELDIPFYLNIHDPFPWHLYPFPYKKSKNIINAKLERKFNIALKKASGISFPSKYLMEDLAKTFPVILRNGYVIPHIGTSLSNLPSSDEDEQIVLNSEKINIVHAGSLLGPRNPKYLIQAILELHYEKPDKLEGVEFTFIGKVARELKELVHSNGKGNIRFLDFRVSYKKSVELIKQSDAMLVIEAISNFSPFLPGKFSDIVYNNKPIIALSPKRSEVRRLLTNGYKYQTSLDDAASIKIVLENFIDDLKQRRLQTDKIKQLHNYVSIQNNVRVIKKVLG